MMYNCKRDDHLGIVIHRGVVGRQRAAYCAGFCRQMPQCSAEEPKRHRQRGAAFVHDVGCDLRNARIDGERPRFQRAVVVLARTGHHGAPAQARGRPYFARLAFFGHIVIGVSAEPVERMIREKVHRAYRPFMSSKRRMRRSSRLAAALTLLPVSMLSNTAGSESAVRVP